MPIVRPPRAGSPHITPQIAQAMLVWITDYVEGGLARFVEFYLHAEVYSDPIDALIELEERYGLKAGGLTDEFERRLDRLAQEGKRIALAKLDVLAASDRDAALHYIPESSKAGAFLFCIPEPELLTAFELYAASQPPVHRRSAHPGIFGYLEHVFRARGLPYTASAEEGIHLVGEPVVREHAIEPALSALADPRLSNARKEFEDARRELRNGQLDDAANDAGCAVESTMAALLHAHGRRQPTKHGKDRVQAGPLFDALEVAGVVDRDGDRHLIFGAIDVRDAGSHGAGIAPRHTDRAYVDAGFAAAAIAITYLASKLP